MSVRPRGPIAWRPDPSKPRERRQAAVLADLIARYEQHRREDTLPRGPNGIFYDLRPNGMGNGMTYVKASAAKPERDFGPTEAHKRIVQEVLSLARRAGHIPEAWVADSRAPDPIEDDSWDDGEDAASGVADWAETGAVDAFGLDPQQFQPVYIELRCEAKELMPRVARIAAAYGVPVYSGAGFDGIKGKRALGLRAARREVPTVVLHIGDRDNHGELIYTDLAEDATAWCRSAGAAAGWLTFKRIALTREQARSLGLLDDNGKAEADGIPVAELDRIVTTELDLLTRPTARAEWEAAQDRERELLPAAIRVALCDRFGFTDDQGES